MATLQIFAHKHFIGAVSDIDNGKFINDVKGPSQLGIVVDVSEVEITSEAKELLNKCQREGGSFASIMLTKTDESVRDKYGEFSVGMMGFYKHAFDTSEPVLSRDCDLSCLNAMKLNDDIETPADFIEFVESNS